MKSIFIIAAALVLGACGQLTGYSKICVDGITYLQFSSGATAQFDSTGKPVTCK